MNVTLYSKPSCVQCDATKRELGKCALDYETVDVTQDEEALASIKAMGHMSAPVVIVRDERGEIAMSWSGFRRDEIRALAAQNQAVAA